VSGLLTNLSSAAAAAQLLNILDAVSSTHFSCIDISGALTNFADNNLPGRRTQDGLPRKAEAVCTVRTQTETGFRYETVNGVHCLLTDILYVNGLFYR